MKRSIAAAILLMAVVAVVTGMFTGITKGKEMQVQLNKRDLPEHGLHIVTSLDPSFEGEAISYFKGASKDSIQALKPLSIFITNTADQKVVAFQLKWEFVREDGTVIDQTVSYAEPGILMGHKMPTDPRFKHVHVIEPNKSKFFSLGSTVASDLNEPDRDLVGGSEYPGSPRMDAEIQRAMQQANKDLIQFKTQSAAITNVTVSIDGAFFEDGTFVGPNSSNFFERIQAEVRAKTDLLRNLEQANKQGKSEEAFAAIEAKTQEISAKLGSEPTPEDYYTFYTKIFADEITGLKNAYGKETALSHILMTHERVRPTLRKKA